MFAAAALVLAVFLFIKYPAFRKLTLLVGVAVIVGIIALIGYLKQQDADRERKQEAAKHLVTPTSLVLDDMRLGPEYGGYRLTGRAKNTSQYTITIMTLKVLISDCDPAGHCDVVGDKEQEIVLQIPPGQARDMDESLFMEHGTKIRNTMQWSYTVLSVRAEQ